MSTASVDIKQAEASMTDLLEESEHCWMDPELAARLGVTVGEQIRVIRSENEYALYTVSSLYQDGPDDNDLRIGLGGRQRLGSSRRFSGWVDTRVPHPTYTDTEAMAYSEFVERLIDPPGQPANIVIGAPHGGQIERHTDVQAEAMAATAPLSACAPVVWTCKGWRAGGGAFARWHVMSTEINPASFPLLGSIASRGFRYAVSFHGMSGDAEVYVGGAAPRLLKEHVKNAIQSVLPPSYRVVIPHGRLDGNDPTNFVNWLTASGANGVQVEQTMDARRDHGIAIAEALAHLFHSMM